MADVVITARIFPVLTTAHVWRDKPSVQIIRPASVSELHLADDVIIFIDFSALLIAVHFSRKNKKNM